MLFCSTFYLNRGIRPPEPYQARGISSVGLQTVEYSTKHCATLERRSHNSPIRYPEVASSILAFRTTLSHSFFAKIYRNFCCWRLGRLSLLIDHNNNIMKGI